MVKKLEVVVPSMGESVQEVVLSRYIVADGALVTKDAEIAELETDKVNQVLYAPESGKIEFCAKEDALLQIGELVAHIDTSVDTSNEKSTSKDSKSKEVSSVKVEVSPLKSFQKQQSQSTAKSSPVKTDPAAKHEKSAQNQSSAALPANDLPSARVNLEQYVAEIKNNAGDARSSHSPASAQSGDSITIHREISRTPLPKIRKVIAERLHYAKLSTAMLTTFNEVDMSCVLKMRSELKDAFFEKHGVKLGFMSFFIKAVCSALEKYPGLNSYIDGDALVQRHYCDISVAVSTERGLMVPVLRSCDQMHFSGIEKGIVELAKKARDGKLKSEDMEGGGFTVTNGGVFGSLLSTPILNPPQSGILGMHTIQKRAVVIDDAIVVRPMMYLALSYDHRVVDGKEAVGFLVEVKNRLEDPGKMLLDI